MEVKTIEHLELIATRVPPSDRWSLTDDPKNVVHKSLTDALQAFFEKTQFKGSYRLDPLDSKLYAIKTHEEEIKKEEPKVYSIYGDWKQGI